MAIQVIMPQMGESIAEGTVAKWLKKVGEQVERDEPLFEISTDKVDAEIPSPAKGVLKEILVPEGQTVPINTVVAVMEESQPSTVSMEPAMKPSREAPGAAMEVLAVPSMAPGAPGVLSREELRRTRSSPLVRRMAKEHGVEISQIEGTGLSGRVTRDDFLAFLQGRAPVPAGVSPAPAGVPRASGSPSPAMAGAPPGEVPAGQLELLPESIQIPPQNIAVEPMSVMRKRIAEHMVMSRSTSAHVTTVWEIDMTGVVRLRDTHAEEFLRTYETKLTFMPFITKACVDALKAFPVMNASIQGENIVYKREINIGIAVALDWGLIVPVLKNADEKNLLGLARGIADLAERARKKRLLPEDVQGGTFTITNPGIFGSLFGTPIINQPQVGILGVGAVGKRAVVIQDMLAIRPMVYFSLSFDHRLIDGSTADRFMAHIKKTLEEWKNLAM